MFVTVGTTPGQIYLAQVVFCPRAVLRAALFRSEIRTSHPTWGPLAFGGLSYSNPSSAPCSLIRYCWIFCSSSASRCRVQSATAVSASVRNGLRWWTSPSGDERQAWMALGLCAPGLVWSPTLPAGQPPFNFNQTRYTTPALSARLTSRYNGNIAQPNPSVRVVTPLVLFTLKACAPPGLAILFQNCEEQLCPKSCDE